MQHQSLGGTGIMVSELCLGTMNMGASWGNGDEAECTRIVAAALDAGINFVDTADVYSSGESEEIVGRALKGRRDDVILATKFHGSMGPDRNMRGSSRRWMVRAVEDSLRRLGTDWIDLYQAHRPDPDCDLEETLEAAHDLISQGKIRCFGSSNYPAELLVEASIAGAAPGTGRTSSNQVAYSLFVRSPERDIIPACRRRSIAVLAFSPLNGGWLAGRYDRDRTPAAESRMGRGRTPERYDFERQGNAAKFDLLPRLADIATQAGTTLPLLALAWTRVHPAVTSTILGPRTVAHLDHALASLDLRLSDEVLDAIDDVIAPGTTLNEPDIGWVSPGLDASARRRVRA